MCSFLVWKKARLDYREFEIQGDLVGATPYMVFIGSVFHDTIKTCLKRVGHCGFEWVEKEMCRFAEDMS